MRTRPSLTRQITLGLVVYGVLLSVALFVHGLLVNEQAERMVWQAMLETSMDDLLERRRHDPGFGWRNNGRLDLHVLDPADARVPDTLRPLAPGLHDNVFFGDNEWVVLVREEAGIRYALALDIDGFEDLEWELVKPVIASSVLFMLLLGSAVYFGARLLARPLRDLAADIGTLSPDRRGLRIGVPARASSELTVIAGALNDYLARNDQFVDRERAFIDTASHELRTPMAVIRSAAQIALSGPGDDAPRQLERIARATREVEQLISMLLLLAKDPARVTAAAERFRLDEMLPAVVDDHRHLATGKDLTFMVGPLAPCTLVAPEAVVRLAIGNLLRNAIEHSDRGEIRLTLDAAGQVEIRDPGHGMTPEEISALYARLARGSDRGSGIGLALIARLSEHLGWRLSIEPGGDQGTVARLDFGGAQQG